MCRDDVKQIPAASEDFRRVERRLEHLANPTEVLGCHGADGSRVTHA
jgi:hypothetical protein